MTKEEFINLVLDYGAFGTKVLAGIPHDKREAIILAWREVNHSETRQLFADEYFEKVYDDVVVEEGWTRTRDELVTLVKSCIDRCDTLLWYSLSEEEKEIVRHQAWCIKNIQKGMELELFRPETTRIFESYYKEFEGVSK